MKGSNFVYLLIRRGGGRDLCDVIVGGIFREDRVRKGNVDFRFLIEGG